MGMMKSYYPLDGRYPILKGIDFKGVETRDSAFSGTPGTVIRFRGSTEYATMGYNHATYGGIRIVCSAMSSGNSSRGLSLILTPTLATGGIRQGGLYVEMQRYTATTTADGNYDIAVKIFARNRAAGEAYTRTRGMELTTEVRDSGSGNYAMDGIYCAVKTRSGTHLGAGGAIAIKAETNMGADCTGGEVIGVNIHDIGQTATPSSIYGLKITTASYAITRKSAIRIENSGGAWTNGIQMAGTITYTLAFAEADGSQGYTAVVNKTHQGTVDGYFTLRDETTGATLYVLAWDAVPS